MKSLLSHLLVACALLSGTACGPRFQITAPRGFVVLDQSEPYDFRATTPDGLVLAVREFENTKEYGDLSFWVEAIQNELRLDKGYALIRESDITSTQLAGSYVSHFLTGRTPAAVEDAVALSRALLDQITTEEVDAIAQRWKDRRNLVLIAVVPEKDDVVPPTEEALLAVLDDQPADDVTVATWIGPRPATFWFRRMAIEAALHRYDAQTAVGATTPIGAELAVDAIDEMLTTAPAPLSSRAARAARTIW